MPPIRERSIYWAVVSHRVRLVFAPAKVYAHPQLRVGKWSDRIFIYERETNSINETPILYASQLGPVAQFKGLDRCGIMLVSLLERMPIMMGHRQQRKNKLFYTLLYFVFARSTNPAGQPAP